MNKQVIQKIIASQINAKKPMLTTTSPSHNNIHETPFLFEKYPLTTPKNPFYLPIKPLDMTESKKFHPSNKSMDLPNFRITKNKIANNIQHFTSDKETRQTETDIPSSKSPTMMIKTSSNFFISKEKLEIKIEVVLPDEKTITFAIDDLEGKTIKVLKNKILNEIRNSMELVKFENIVSFKTTNKLYLIDYAMDFDSHLLPFLLEREGLSLTPIFRERK